MATTTSQGAYCPGIACEFLWDDKQCGVGGWRVILQHDLVLCNHEDAGVGTLLPAGSELQLDLGEPRTTVFLPGPATHLPPDVVQQQLKNVEQLEHDLRQAEQVPF